ncbi:hematopoietically-expressed homeobox protein hhex-like [Lingula anatina]|nr:hematopoietically-expressed homeobox protein hhex-like [Lingula anatina]|eukprot:XP_013417733.1 hematopoietically-expressed homeobox protein hhex-like [Lingula anatina]
MKVLQVVTQGETMNNNGTENLLSAVQAQNDRNSNDQKHSTSGLKFGIDSILASQAKIKSAAEKDIKDLEEIRRANDLERFASQGSTSRVAASTTPTTTSPLAGITPPSPSSPMLPLSSAAAAESPSLFSSLYNYWSMFPYIGAGDAFSALVHQREAMLRFSTVSDITKQTALPPSVTASMMDYYSQLQAAPLRSKRLWKRTVYTPEQKRYLESQFQAQKFVDVFERRRLAFVLGLTDENVKVWFQNRRKRWRRALMQGDGSLKTLDSLEDYRKFQAQRNSVDPDDMEEVIEDEDE